MNMELEKKMAGRKYAYARVSSASQNLDRQLDRLEKYVPAENIVVDKESGKDLNRRGYQALKGALGLRAGDTLYLTSLDRLSRNKNDIKCELEWFKAHGVRLVVLDLPTTLVQIPQGQEWILDMINNIMIEVLASISEQERITIRKRQKEGIEAAKRKGKHMGRPRIKKPDDFENVYQQWKSGAITAKRAMGILKMTSSSFYRMVQKHECEASKCIKSRE